MERQERMKFSTSMLVPSLAEALEKGGAEALLGVMEQPIFGVWAFDCFKEEACSQFLQEIERISKVKRSNKPNSMNRYGVVLDSFGFSPFIEQLLHQLISPIASILFPQQGGNNLLYHHAFIIRYCLGEDVKLKEHLDDADVTLNICLGKQFKGGQLFFRGLQDSAIVRVPKALPQFDRTEKTYTLDHKVGTALIHLGRHVHGAFPITEGERTNLIVWCKTKPYDKELYNMHDS